MHQATNPARRALGPIGRSFGKAMQRSGHLTAPVYPKIPAGWPNRATRRAIKQGSDNRLTGEWRQLLVAKPELRKAIVLM
jgi:hypothetical protein